MSDKDFEKGLQLIRSTFSSKINEKDTEIITLKATIARQSSEHKELKSRLSSMEITLQSKEQELRKLREKIQKLEKFRKNVLESFGKDEYDELSGFSNGSSGSQGKSLENEKKISFYETNGYYNAGSNRNHSSSTNSNPNPANIVTAANNNTSNAANNNANGFDFTTHSTPSQRFKEQPDQSEESAVETGLLLQKNDIITNTTTATTAAAGIRFNDKSDTRKRNNMFSRESQYSNEPTSTNLNTGGDFASSETTVDGREYFKKAKSVLSYDEFTGLLFNVKAYNAREQSRYRTLESVYSIIGQKYPQMFKEFEILLS